MVPSPVHQRANSSTHSVTAPQALVSLTHGGATLAWCGRHASRDEPSKPRLQLRTRGAIREGSYGGTMAHPLLSLALSPSLSALSAPASLLLLHGAAHGHAALLPE